MKTQFSFSKRGFTLVELMIVIAIIGIIFGVMSQISFRSQQNITKAERLANQIQSILHTSAVSVMMGRMDQSTPPIATTGATVTISATGSSAPNTVTWQFAPTLSGVFRAPFFDNDQLYEIRSIRGFSPTSSGTTSTVTIMMGKDGTTFTGTSDNSFFATAHTLEIQVRYVDMTKRVIYDRRTGRIEISKEF